MFGSLTFFFFLEEMHKIKCAKNVFGIGALCVLCVFAGFVYVTGCRGILTSVNSLERESSENVPPVSAASEGVGLTDVFRVAKRWRLCVISVLLWVYCFIE